MLPNPASPTAVPPRDGAIEKVATAVPPDDRAVEGLPDPPHEPSYRRFFEESIAGCYCTTVEGRILVANRACATLLGADSPADLREHTSLSFYVDPGDRLRFLDELRRDGKTRAFEVRLRRLDGRVVWVLLSGLLDDSGPEPVLLGTMIDVTARRQAELALSRSERRFGLAVEHYPSPVLLCDPAGRFEFVNRSGRELLSSLGVPEPVGREALAVLPRWLLAPVVPAVRTAMASGRATRIELRLRSHGATRDLDLLLLLMDDGDGSPQLLAVGHNSSEGHATQRHRLLLGTAFLQAGEGMLITDSEGRIEIVNPAFAETTGFSLEEALGHRPEELLRIDFDDGLTRRELVDTLAAGEVWQGHMATRTKSGRRHSELVTITPVADPWDGRTRLVSVHREVGKLEEQLHQARRMEAIGRLAGGIAHDFNNLLTVIQGNGEVLRAVLGNDDDRLMADELLSASERAARLTGQLLAFSRRQMLQTVIIDLDTIVTEVSPLLRRLIGEHIRVEVETSQATPTVRADPGQIEQVIMNLVINARDAMAGGGCVRIETGRVAGAEAAALRELHPQMPARTWARLAVVDDGAGMHPEVLESVFEPFFTTKQPGSGTGLGLATTYGIVKQHEGWIWIDSAPGRGTKVEIFLPARNQTGGAKAERGAGAEGVVQQRAATGASVLVVEDEPSLRNLAARTLQGEGLQVLEAGSADEALEAVAGLDEPLDLLLTDIVLPGRTGRELYRLIADSQPDLRVVFMSGYSDDPSSLDSRGEDAPPLLRKPFSLRELRRTVAKALA